MLQDMTKKLCETCTRGRKEQMSFLYFLQQQYFFFFILFVAFAFWMIFRSSVTLSDLLDFVFLSNGPRRLGVVLLSVDDLVGESFSDGFH